jgi:Icc-related predicted phosphoesterase
VLGGDITGKSIVPLVGQRDGSYRVHYKGRSQVVPASSLPEVMRTIEDGGDYPYVTTEEEYEDIRSDPGRVDKLFSQLRRQRLKEWMDLALAKLSRSDVECYVSPGNDDDKDVDDILRSCESVNFTDGVVLRVGDLFEMASVGWSNPTPWNTPRETSEEDLWRKIEKVASGVKNMDSAIFNLHCPPFDSTLDAAPKLDENLRPVVTAGGAITEPVGSTSVRRAIEEYQPLLGLHGHIHESRGIKKIGRTICVNPGSEYGQGVLNGVIINLTPEKVVSYQFTRG